jgi:hypothetical protein
MHPIRIEWRITRTSSCPDFRVTCTPEKRTNKKVGLIIPLLAVVVSCSVPAWAQEKNEVGLVIGSVVTPSQANWECGLDK